MERQTSRLATADHYFASVSPVEEAAGERRVALTLAKAQPTLWWCVIKGHPELDMQALNAIASTYAAGGDGVPGQMSFGFEE